MSGPEMGRQEGRFQTSIRLPEELHDKLVAEAEMRDVSVNFLINRAIVRYLDQLIPLEEMGL